ncbi:aminomethyl-transferring glycine dehydrogenase subunit GcvPA [Acinetobacter baumannii]|uniref:Glycine dehydrogenase (Aminomethyl-transferring) n=1 Tax=Acinetobacter baumannii TaxID=470 RepID=A0A241ZH40_ACIBA|nr:aminomethyl-transferring glycine dehydrogenase subunit GcvPA [Acinetobacter baumannii]OTM91391.1 glycine dehydrogenase (aminomethyl-transferring) [Acinetobacter baumannii]
MTNRAHPFMANSTEAIKQEMLKSIGVDQLDDLFIEIPKEHIATDHIKLPDPLTSEVSLKKHILNILKKNLHCENAINFLGAGCWQHHVPAICDEIANRSEFLTSMWGIPSADHGRNQAWFEYASQLGELVDLEIVSLPVYSWGCAAGHAIRMASRLTGRYKVLVPEIICPERLSVIKNYCQPENTHNRIEITQIKFDEKSGLLDLDDLQKHLSTSVCAIYIEIPNFLGVIETQAKTIANFAKKYGIEFIIGVDPTSLGILASPASLGADIVVGTTQPLGIHMNFGGGLGGFIATRDEERYAREYNALMVSIGTTLKAGEYGFGRPLMHQSSYGLRELGKDWTGTSVYLWAVVNVVYMSTLGPQGFKELGENIIRNSLYAAQKISEIPNVKIKFNKGFFKEFVIDFTATNKTVSQINAALLEKGIFGGLDISTHFPSYGQCALWAVTEVHSLKEIDQAVATLQEVLAHD